MAETDLGFPMNAQEVIKERLQFFMPDHVILNRALRQIDHSRSVGLMVVDWSPNEDSFQIGQQEPALGRYLFRIQNMVKHANEVAGKSLFGFDAKTIRVVLYRDTTLHVRLAELTEDIMFTRESSKRWGVSRQRFVNTDLQGQFTFVAQTEFWLETEFIELGV